MLYVVGGHTLEIEPRGTTTHQNFPPLHLLYFEESEFGLGGHYQSIRPAGESTILPPQSQPGQISSQKSTDNHHLFANRRPEKKVSLNNHNVELNLW